MQQYYGQTPAKPKKDTFLRRNLFPLIICTAGIASIIIGIAALATCGNVYAEFGVGDEVMAHNARGGTKVEGGFSPVVSMIFSILALLLGAASTVFGIIYGSKQAAKGTSKGASTILGIAAGIAGVILCIFALTASSCSTASYCSEKKHNQEIYSSNR